jgi:DNA-binding protein H-NS
MFARPDGEILHLTSAGLKSYRSPVDRLKAIAAHGAVIEPGYELAIKGPDDLNRGEKARYTWLSPTKKLITATLAELERRSTSIFFSTPALPLKADPLKAHFRWTLPDGSLIEATWPELDAALRQILGKPHRHSFMKTGFSIKVHRALSARRREPTALGRFLPLRDLKLARSSMLPSPGYRMLEQAKRAALEEIVDLMAAHQLTVVDLADLGDGKQCQNAAKSSNPSAKSKLPAKYRHPKTGETWSGHGRPPAWIENVKNRSRFLTTPGAHASVTKQQMKTTNALKGKRRNTKTVAPKYRDPRTGVTWSGRGLAPAWIRDAEDRTLFLIKNET